jgi:quinolinate synthase
MIADDFVVAPAVVVGAGIADALRHMRHEVKVAPAVAERARRAVTRMLAVKA